MNAGGFPRVAAGFDGPPGNVAALVQSLARRLPAVPIFTFLAEDGEPVAELTPAALDLRARAVAAAIGAAGLPHGGRAILLFPSGPDFITALAACLYAGVVAVPAHLPRSRRTLDRLRSIAADARPGMVLTHSALARQLERWLDTMPRPTRPACVFVDAVRPELADRWQERPAAPDDVALLQYTSGSTAEPRGVMIAHANILANEAMIRSALDQSERSVIVSWLPPEHDMGLMGALLQPLYTGSRAIIMPPAAFLRRPRRWLECISRFRATTSGGPNFAYDLCVRRTPPEDRHGLDLSSWSVAFNGSETVREATMRRFAEAFGPCGFQPSAFRPCYGLAEATLLVSAKGAGTRPDSGRVSACGAVPSELHLEVVDPATASPCEQGREGEIWVRGPSVARGYWNQPELTRSTFLARTAAGEGPFLRTGDLGCLRDGQLLITGRLKELVVVRGVKYTPADLELTVQRAHAALAAAPVAAFAVDGADAERLVVAVELEPRAIPDARDLAERVRLAILAEHQLDPADVLLVRAGTLPRTTSGKIQRLACRDRYLSRRLAWVHRLESAPVPAEETTPLTRDALATVAGHERSRLLVADLRAAAATLLRRPADAIDPAQPLHALGLDSLAAVELSRLVEERFDLALDAGESIGEHSIESIAARALAAFDGAPASRQAPESSLAPGASSPALALPVTPKLEALLLFDDRWPAAGAYNLSLTARLAGGLDVARLCSAVVHLAERHEAMRARFAVRGSRRVQWIAAHGAALGYVDAAHADERVTRALLAQSAQRPFDLERDSPVRFILLRRAGGEHVLQVTAHHVVADFHSLEVALAELSLMYAGHALPPVPTTYAGYLEEEQRKQDGPEGARARRFWEQELSRNVPALRLPVDHPRAAHETFRAGEVAVSLDAALVRRLTSTASAQRATAHAALLAAFQGLLFRWCGQSEFRVLTTAAGRDRLARADLVAYVASPVLVRAELTGNTSFEELLADARARLAEAIAHFGSPHAASASGAPAGPSPAFTTHVGLLGTPRAGLEELAAVALGIPDARVTLGPLVFESEPIAGRRTPFDLSLELAHFRGGIAGCLRYRSDLFDRTTMSRLAAQFERMVEAMAGNPCRRVSEVALLTKAERHHVTVEWNATAGGPPAAASLPEVWERQAARAPHAIALEHAGTLWSYDALNRRANRWARRLRRRGVGAEVRVAIWLDRGPDLAVALLAVLKAGGAYVPLDRGYPAARLAAHLEASGAALVLGPPDGSVLPGAPAVVPFGGELDEPDTNLELPIHPAQLAYVLATSGSTGVPKGVGLTHDSAVRLLAWVGGRYPASALEGVLAATALGFDLSVFELLGTWSQGGRAILVESALELSGATRGVRLVNSVPSVVAALLRSGRLPSGVEVVNLAGEVLDHALATELYARGVREVWNLYGPTEDTTYSTAGRVPAHGVGPASIGRPLPGREAFVVEASGELATPGTIGELYLGGAGLARGYIDQPVATAARWVPHPWSSRPGARLYRTGDRARWRADGALEYVGRADQQIKLRGHRIELGDVEAGVRTLAGVRETAVRLHADRGAEPRLVAYVAADAGVAGADLAREAAAILPPFMIPSQWMLLDALPRLPNGKVDRAGLPEPLPEDETPRAPSSSIETAVAEIWSEALNRTVRDTSASFFACGGHSLAALDVASRVRHRLGVDLPVRAVFEHSTIAALSAEIERRGTRALAAGVVSRDRDTPFRATSTQQRIWWFQRRRPHSPAYNMAAVIRWKHADAARLRAAVDALVRRHEALRTTFFEEGDTLWQRVGSATPVAMPIVDLAGVPERVRDREAARIARTWCAAPFDLANGPVFRVALLRLGASGDRLLVSVHHVAADGWSLGVLARDLAAAYRGAPGDPALPPPAQFADFAAGRQAEADAGRANVRAGDEPPPLDLAGLHKPSGESGREAGIHRFAIPRDVAARVRAVCEEESATPFAAFLGVFAALLRRSSGQSDLAIACPAAGRVDAASQAAVGCFVHLFPVRFRMARGTTLRDVLRSARAQTAAALDARANDAATALTLQATFSYEQPLDWPDLAEAGATSLEIVPGPPKFDLSLTLTDGTPPRGAIEYDAGLFDAASMRQMADRYVHLARLAASDPDRPLDDLPGLPRAARHQVVVEWNDTTTTEPGDTPVHELVEARAREAPQAVAVVQGGERLDYGELNRRANRLARRLLALGVRADEPVALLLPRSIPAAIAILAVAKTGAAYLPIDPRDPDDRVRRLLDDAGARILIADRAVPCAQRVVRVGRASDQPEAGDEANPGSAVAGEQLAYVIYTSGSTGAPKGVALTHRGLANLVRWHIRTYGIDAADRATLLAPVAFDGSVWELWPYLCAGASVHVPDDETRTSPEALVRWLTGERITNCFMPTMLATAVLRAGWPAHTTVRHLLTGGERLAGGIVPAGGPRVVNHYGPTEATVVTTAALVREGARTPPIGRPIDNVRVYLLDAQLEPVPPGRDGDIFIAGKGLAREYLRQPALTAAAFVPDPFSEGAGARMYRTGDVGRYRPDGTIEFVGRRDAQLKIRGFRVEPAEIEAVVHAHPAVAQAVAIGRTALACYVELRPGRAAAVPDIRAFARAQLPAHMVPAFVVVDRMPLTANGKVDRDALERLGAPAAARREPGLTPIQEAVSAVWADLLQIDAVSPDDRFFDCGGHSLLATRLGARLADLAGAEVPLAELLDNPTLAQVARLVEARLGSDVPAAWPPLRRRDGTEPVPAGPLQERLWFLSQAAESSVAYNVTALIRLRGALDERALARSFQLVAARHGTLRTRFDFRDGPVQIVDPAPRLPLPVTDLSSLPPDDREREARRIAAHDARRPFDLRHAPLARARLLRFGAADHALVLSLHHIICDAWSMNVLGRDLAASYRALVSGAPPALTPLPVQYVDFTEWQRRWLAPARREAQLRYWTRQLAEPRPPRLLAAQAAQAPAPAHAGASHTFEVDPELARAVRLLSRREGVTVFMTLLATLQVLLFRLTGEPDVIVGTDISNRYPSETEELVGFFINSVALRTDLGGSPSFVELLRRTRRTCLDAYAHRDVPFHEVVRALNPRREAGGNPIFQVMFVLQNTPRLAWALPGIETQCEPVDESSAFDLTLSIRDEQDGGLHGTLRYATSIVDAAGIEHLRRTYLSLLRQAVDGPSSPIDSLRVEPSQARIAALQRDQERRMNPPGRRLPSLRASSPRPVTYAAAGLVTVAEIGPGQPLPLVIRPSVADVDPAAWARSHRQTIDGHLSRAGALLFRGFDVDSLDRFEAFARAVCDELIEYGERSSPRSQLQGRVYTSTDHPADQDIFLHNEQSYTLEWPMTLLFYCVEPATRGGQTPLADSRRVLARLPQALRERFAARQVMYLRNYGNGLGLSWEQTFQTADRGGVEEHCRQRDIALEWREGGRLRTRQVRPAIRRHPRTGEEVWFNHAAFFHPSTLDDRTRAALDAGVAAGELPFNACYGDGSSLEPETLDEIRRAYREETVGFTWQRHDVLLLDNMLVAHGRQPYEGPRRIAAAMGDPVGRR